MRYWATPDITNGIAKSVKIMTTGNSKPIAIPPSAGEMIAPNLPRPIPHPIPVVRISIGYNLADTEYNPTKPP
jgi:hypothetical protein